MILVYDGSFEGFLSLVYEVYYKKLQPLKIVKQLPNTLLLDEIIEIHYDEQNSLKVLNSIKEYLEVVLLFFEVVTFYNIPHRLKIKTPQKCHHIAKIGRAHV